jgi:phosphoglucomutase
VIARRGCCAAQPSETPKPSRRFYAESFKEEANLDAIVSEAQAMVNKALAAAG